MKIAFVDMWMQKDTLDIIAADVVRDGLGRTSNIVYHCSQNGEIVNHVVEIGATLSAYPPLISIPHAIADDLLKALLIELVKRYGLPEQKESEGIITTQKDEIAWSRRIIESLLKPVGSYKGEYPPIVCHGRMTARGDAGSSPAPAGVFEESSK